MNSEEKIIELESRIQKLEAQVEDLQAKVGGKAIAVSTSVVEQAPIIENSPAIENSPVLNEAPIKVVADAAPQPETVAQATIASSDLTPDTTYSGKAAQQTTYTDTSYSGRLAQAKAQQATQTVSSIPATQPAHSTPAATTANPAQAQSVQAQSVQPTHVQSHPVQTKPVQATPSKESKKGWEEKIGRNVMGIVASVLVFLGIILLGCIIYESLSDVIKFIAMYVISVTPAVIGLTRMKKSDKLKVFYTALAGCGMGAIYISLILTHYVFGYISEFPLVILLLIWTLFTAYLSKVRSEIFVYICYAGLSISTILCAIKWEGFPISLVFYALGIGVLFAINAKKEYNKNAFYFIQLPIMAIILTCIYSESPIIRLIIVLAPIIVLFVQNIIFDIQKENNKIFIPVTVLTFISMLLSEVTLRDELGTELVKYCFAILFIITAIFYYFAHYKEDKNLAPFLVAYYFAVVVVYETFTPWLLITACILLAMGIYLKHDHFKYVGYGYLALSMLLPTATFPSIALEEKGVVVLLLVAIIIGITILLTKKDRNQVDKYIQTAFLAAIPVQLFVSDIICMGVFILLIGLVSIMCSTKFFRNSIVTGEVEESSLIISYVVNGIVMLLSLAAINTYHGEVQIYNVIPGSEWLTATILIATAVVVFMLNTLKLFDLKLPEMVVGVYIGVKITLLVICILTRFEVAGFLISIVCLCLAVGCVVLGFYLKKKPFRLYGLVLTLICVAKLILIDINYSTSLLRPIGFIAAGVLCFGISWIYSKLEKSELNSDDPKEN